MSRDCNKKTEKGKLKQMNWQAITSVVHQTVLIPLLDQTWLIYNVKIPPENDYYCVWKAVCVNVHVSLCILYSQVVTNMSSTVTAFQLLIAIVSSFPFLACQNRFSPSWSESALSVLRQHRWKSPHPVYIPTLPSLLQTSNIGHLGQSTRPATYSPCRPRTRNNPHGNAPPGHYLMSQCVKASIRESPCC